MFTLLLRYPLVRTHWAVMFVIAIFPACLSSAADVSVERKRDDRSNSSARIRFSNGDTMVGELVESNLDYYIGLKLPQFTEPFYCSLDLIGTVDFIDKEVANNLSQNCKIELINEDSFYGEILEWTKDRAVIETEKFGQIELDPEYIRSIVSASQNPKLLFRGINDESAWMMLKKDRAFYVETGSLLTKQRAAKARIDAKLPDKCIIDLQLSWERRPSFVLNFACDNNEKATSGFLLETIEGEFGILREHQGRAVLDFVGQIDNRSNNAEFRIYLDQEKGFFGVRQNSEKFGSITLPTEDQEIRTYFQIENYGKELRLDSFQVIEWDGSVPASFKSDTGVAEIENEGLVLFDRIESYDVEKREFTYSVGDAVKTRSIDDSVFTARISTIVESKNDKNEPDESENRDNRKYNLVIQCDGLERLTGLWQSQTNGNFNIQPDWSLRPVAVPLDRLISITGDPKLKTVKPQNRLGTLLIDGMEIPGCLVNATSDDKSNASCLSWQPRVSLNAAPVRNDQNGEISYQRKRNTGRGSAVTARNLQAAQVRQPWGQQSNPSRDSAKVRAKYRVPSGLQLRSSDLVASENVEYRNNRLFFESPNTRVTSLDESEVQSVRFYSARNRVNLSQEKIERLLTVPRTNQSDPPTHMLIARNGDYLRGRLIRLDSENAVFEVRYSELTIPRKVISSIVWLHDRNWSLTKNAGDSTGKTETGKKETGKKPDSGEGSIESPEPSGRFAVHLTGGVESRMTFFPVKFEKTFLIGDSPLLAECKKTITTVSRIIFGPNAAKSAREMHGSPWTLELAKLPTVYTDAGDSSDRSSAGGTAVLGDHPLVGKEAPDFRLKNLDDTNVTLSDLRGKIVVLDFWASWCGPCIQALPKVHSVVAEYQEDEIALLAVNVSESAERAGPTASRLGLPNTEVVLDSTGGTSAEYQATAIPQTVIVDSSGIIRAVFVGGSRSLEADLKTVIDRCKTGEAKNADAATDETATE